MSDMRFIMIGIGLVFIGFIIIGVLGSSYQAGTLESDEFGTCYEYFNDKPPKEIDCSFKIFDQTLFFAVVIGFVGSGIIALIKGMKGDWDNKVNPDDMVGPNRNQNERPDESDESKS